MRRLLIAAAMVCLILAGSAWADVGGSNPTDVSGLTAATNALDLKVTALMAATNALDLKVTALMAATNALAATIAGLAPPIDSRAVTANVNCAAFSFSDMGTLSAHRGIFATNAAVVALVVSNSNPSANALLQEWWTSAGLRGSLDEDGDFVAKGDTHSFGSDTVGSYGTLTIQSGGTTPAYMVVKGGSTVAPSNVFSKISFSQGNLQNLHLAAAEDENFYQVADLLLQSVQTNDGAIASRFWFSNEGYLGVVGQLGQAVVAPVAPLDNQGGWMGIRTNNSQAVAPTLGTGYAGLWTKNVGGTAKMYVGMGATWEPVGTTLDDNEAVKYDATANGMADDSYCGITITGRTAGESVAQWDCVFFNSADSEWHQADANAAGEFPARGLVVNAANDGEAAVLLVQGIVRNDGWNWATIGGPLYLGETAGGMTQTAPADAGDCVQVVGWAISDDEAYINFSGHWLVN